MTKIERLEKRRKELLRGFTIGQLDNPQLARDIQTALTNIDLSLCQEK